MARSILLKSAPLIVLGLLYGGQAAAGPVNCSQGSVAITQTKQVTPAPGTAWVTTPIATTACLLINGNDVPLPKDNLGYYGDGIMNGGAMPKKDPVFPNGAFIDGPNDPHLQDLDGDGKKNDAGWVLLGKYDSNAGFNPADTILGQDNAKNQLFKPEYFSMSCNGRGGPIGCKAGTWQLAPPATIKEQLAALNFKGFFNRLMIVLKSNPGFALYYFDFTKMPSFNLNEVYNFKGTFNTGAFLNPQGKIQGLSHASIYVGDPVGDSRDVPEPAALSLLGLGLFGLGFVRKSAKRRTQGTPA